MFNIPLNQAGAEALEIFVEDQIINDENLVYFDDPLNVSQW